MDNPVHLASVRELGAEPVPMSWGDEVLTALRTKAIDGQENPVGIIWANEMDKIQKYLSLTGLFYSSAPFCMNKTKFDSLKTQWQTMFMEAAKEAAAFEKKIINLTEIPDNYIEITSGLGKSNPNNLILVPLILNDEIYGVIELASFELFDEHHIEYLEQSAESIASIVSSMQINITTKALLEKTQVQAEEQTQSATNALRGVKLGFGFDRGFGVVGNIGKLNGFIGNKGASLDYILQKDSLQIEVPGVVFWYVGAGGYGDWDDGDIGARLPVGAEWHFAKNLDAYAQIMPRLRVNNSARFGLDAGIGVRYQF